MQSALLVHSRHTKDYAELISNEYENVEFLEVTKPPSEDTVNIKNDKDVVIGIGGGSVIDTAKIISKNKRCIAIPTTAAGASMTPYATVWGEKKISIPTKKPILRMDYNMPINLPIGVMRSTAFDALSHAIESFWSKYATPQTRRYSKQAISLINKLLRKNKGTLKREDIYELIAAGNIAGKAIAITKTNVVHAISYTITIRHGIDHATACGMVLPYVIEYMDFKGLPETFGLDSTKELVVFLKRLFIPPKIRNFDFRMIADESIKYDKINNGPKKIEKNSLMKILAAMI